MRNAGKRDRGHERAVASLGKHYPFPYSQPHSEPVAVSFGDCVGNTFSFTGADVCISHFQPRSNGVGWLDARADEFTRGISKSSQQTKAVNPGKPIAQAANADECLDLMHRLMAYRHDPIHSELMKIRDSDGGFPFPERQSVVEMDERVFMRR